MDWPKKTILYSEIDGESFSPEAIYGTFLAVDFEHEKAHI